MSTAQAAGAVVVDTDVVSFLFRQDTRAQLYRPHLQGNVLMVSFMTIAEIERWMLQRNWGPVRRADMEAHLDRFVTRPSTRTLCSIWAEVVTTAQRNGRPIAVADAWHAATALVRRAPLVTHNNADFEAIPGLTVITERTG